MYVPDDSTVTLGNPDIFGFIGKAVKSVVGVAGQVVKGVIGGGSVQVAPPTVILQSPPPTVGLPGSMPSWVLPVAIGGGVLALTMLMRKRSR